MARNNRWVTNLLLQDHSQRDQSQLPENLALEKHGNENYGKLAENMQLVFLKRKLGLHQETRERQDP